MIHIYFSFWHIKFLKEKKNDAINSDNLPFRGRPVFRNETYHGFLGVPYVQEEYKL